MSARAGLHADGQASADFSDTPESGRQVQRSGERDREGSFRPEDSGNRRIRKSVSNKSRFKGGIR